MSPWHKLKIVFLRGSPIFGHFLAVLGILAEITVRYWLSTDFTFANKNERKLYGVALEVI